MLLDPVNAVTSVSFYRKVARQSPLRTAGYLLYLALLFTGASLVALKTRVMPAVYEAMAWLGDSVPPLTFAKGEVSAAQDAPVELRHPKAPSFGIVIDTARAEPVTLELMKEKRARAYLGKKTLTLQEREGELRVYQLGNALSDAKPVVVDRGFFDEATRLLPYFLYPSAGAVTFGLFLAWKGFATVAFMMVGLLLNAIAGASLLPGPLFAVALYAQTLVIILQAMSLFLPQMLVIFPFASVAATGIYIWLAVKASKQEEAPSEPSSPPPS